MPPRDWQFRIQDMLDAIEKIREYTADLDASTFSANPMVVDAVIRNLTLLGEAACALPSHVRQAHAEIPWNKMQSMRNALVHEYFGVSITIVWQTVSSDLAPLVPQLETLLRSDQES